MFQLGLSLIQSPLLLMNQIEITRNKMISDVYQLFTVYIDLHFPIDSAFLILFDLLDSFVGFSVIVLCFGVLAFDFIFFFFFALSRCGNVDLIRRCFFFFAFDAVAFVSIFFNISEFTIAFLVRLVDIPCFLHTLTNCSLFKCSNCFRNDNISLLQSMPVDAIPRGLEKFWCLNKIPDRQVNIDNTSLW